MSDLPPVTFGVEVADEAIAAAVRALDATGQLEGTGLLEHVARVVVGAAAPLIAAQALREDEERTEWGVRWHGADVIHGTAGDGNPVYDEVSARVVAATHANAVAVHRRAAGPWVEAAKIDVPDRAAREAARRAD